MDSDAKIEDAAEWRVEDCNPGSHSSRTNMQGEEDTAISSKNEPTANDPPREQKGRKF